VLKPQEELDPHLYEEAARFAGLKTADYIGRLGEKVEPDSIVQYAWHLFHKHTYHAKALVFAACTHNRF
jgi:hypothetical protein